MILVVMGVCGSGKTTVGRLIAEWLDWVFIEGDDLHPEANRRKMAAGTPLTDKDRWRWLDRIFELPRPQDSPETARLRAHSRPLGSVLR